MSYKKEELCFCLISFFCGYCIHYTDSDEHKTRQLLSSSSENTTLNCRLVASAFGSNPFSCCCHPLLPTPRVCQFTAKLWQMLGWEKHAVLQGSDRREACKINGKQGRMCCSLWNCALSLCRWVANGSVLQYIRRSESPCLIEDE